MARTTVRRVRRVVMCVEASFGLGVVVEVVGDCVISWGREDD